MKTGCRLVPGSVFVVWAAFREGALAKQLRHSRKLLFIGEAVDTDCS